jgi:hypothetical protein
MADPRIADLVRQSQSEAAAEVYLAFRPTEDQISQIGEVGREILIHVRPVPGACAPMSALYAAILHDRMPGTIVHMVAGALAVEEKYVFGQATDRVDGNDIFGRSNPSWDGHSWLICGDYIVDISLFRTAYSAQSPPLLARYVHAEFGKGRGLLISKYESGLRYEPQYVLTSDQITAVGRSAMKMFLPG